MPCFVAIHERPALFGIEMKKSSYMGQRGRLGEGMGGEEREGDCGLDVK